MLNDGSLCYYAICKCEHHTQWKSAPSPSKTKTPTFPASRTIMRSLSMIVFSLCAMIIMVHVLNSSRIVFWMRASVPTSTAAVASSKTRILERRNNARAKLNSCLCPTLKFSPPSCTFKIATGKENHNKRLSLSNPRLYFSKTLCSPTFLFSTLSCFQTAVNKVVIESRCMEGNWSQTSKNLESSSLMVIK